ncbi:MAG: hypothetical protein AB8B95_12160 [Pseudohongiellaceae bacterium]
MTSALKLVTVLCIATFINACAGPETYRAYFGAPRDALKVASVKGVQYVRNDIINRYVDGVRFAAVDGQDIDESHNFTALELAPGFHDLHVYYFWDMGIQKGLAPALVSYATDTEPMSRVLRFNARAGVAYSVKAAPSFGGEGENITNLTHVDFWVEDQNGVRIVSKEAGSYSP